MQILIKIIIFLSLLAPIYAKEEKLGSFFLEVKGHRQKVNMKYNKDQGNYSLILIKENGEKVSFSPNKFTKYIHKDLLNDKQSYLLRTLNISSYRGILWVLLGLFGQIAFTGRMVIQWIFSERRGKSIVPTAFWWMSLFGSTALIVYFSWRRDIIGVLGQATGWFVYIRNLMLIKKGNSKIENNNA